MPSKRLHPALFAIWCLAFILTSEGRGGVITDYTDRTNFNAALAGETLTVEDFTPDTHYPISTGVLNSQTDLPSIGITPGTIQAGVTYSTTQTNTNVTNFFNIDGANLSANDFKGGFLDGIGSGPLNVAFDSPALGFGFDTDQRMGTSFTVTINFSSGPAVVEKLTGPTSYDTQFFGFVGDSRDITSVQIQGVDAPNGISFALDNFTFTSTAVPEPASLAMLGMGLVAWLGQARRSRRS